MNKKGHWLFYATISSIFSFQRETTKNEETINNCFFSTVGQFFFLIFSVTKRFLIQRSKRLSGYLLYLDIFSAKL